MKLVCVWELHDGSYGGGSQFYIEDPTSQRLHEVDGDLQAWLFGRVDSPGEPSTWVGDPVLGLTLTDLAGDGLHNYVQHSQE